MTPHTSPRKLERGKSNGLAWRHGADQEFYESFDLCWSNGAGEQPPDKKRPPLLAGAKLPWFSRVARALLAAYGGVAVGAEGSLRGVATQHLYWCCSVPVEDAIPWGDVVPWAAKLFSINLICTTLGIRSRLWLAGFGAV